MVPMSMIMNTIKVIQHLCLVHFQVILKKYFEFSLRFNCVSWDASGNTDVVRILLEAGAKTHQTNRIGRTAAQLGAFTGQKACVDVINNYVTLDDLKYYTIPQGK